MFFSSNMRDELVRNISTCLLEMFFRKWIYILMEYSASYIFLRCEDIRPANQPDKNAPFRYEYVLTWGEFRVCFVRINVTAVLALTHNLTDTAMAYFIYGGGGGGGLF